MSHTISIDLDETAALVRENLDLALPHLTNQAHVNPIAALKSVTTQYAYCDLILRNLPDRDLLDIERFEMLRREARGLIAQFWRVYSLFPIELSNGKVAQAQVMEPAPKKHIRHVGGNKLHGKQRKTRVILSDQQKNEIWQYIHDNKPLRQEDYDLLLETYNISKGGVDHIRYEWTPT